MGCRVRRTSEWTTRIMHELQGKDGCFITLTYEDKHLPEGSTLVKSDLQKFLKRLRKYLEPLKIKYYGCGEYGDATKRPHYHIIIIGWKPDSEQNYRPNRKTVASKEIEKLWSFGNNVIGSADREAIQYTVGYIRKKLLGNSAYEYGGLTPPFALQSQKLGLEYCMSHKESILSDKGITRNGKPVGVPRYYRKKLIDKDTVEEYYYHRRAKVKRQEIIDQYMKKEYEDSTDGNKEFRKDYLNCVKAERSDRERRSKNAEALENLHKKGSF